MDIGGFQTLEATHPPLACEFASMFVSAQRATCTKKKDFGLLLEHLRFVGFGNPVAWGRARSRSAQLGSAGRRGGRLRAAFRQPGAGNTAYSSKNCAQAQQSQIIKKNIGFSRCLSSQCRPGGRGLPNATQGTKKRVSQN